MDWILRYIKSNAYIPFSLMVEQHKFRHCLPHFSVGGFHVVGLDQVVYPYLAVTLYDGFLHQYNMIVEWL